MMKCRVCFSEKLSPVIDLGMQPWGNHFLKANEVGKEPLYPLRLIFCNECSTSQLDFTVKKEIMFTNHTYLSGITKSLSNHFREIAFNVNTLFKSRPNKTILDIGSNDGTQLKFYKEIGWDILGVESSTPTAKIANDNNIKTINKFYNYEFAKDINTEFDVINASGVFFHLEELHSVCKGIKHNLKKDGIFVVQFLYIKNIFNNVAFDQIYHEHLLYYSLHTLNYLLNIYDLEIFDANLTKTHGGQMIAYVCHKGIYDKTKNFINLINEEINSNTNKYNTYKLFADRVIGLKEKNLDYLNSMKSNNKIIYGMGAPVKGNTLLNYFKIGTNYLDCLLEKNILRKGMFSPGMHIPILIEDEVKTFPDSYYVLAWNFKDEILFNNQHLIEKGVEFYFPIDIV